MESKFVKSLFTKSKLNKEDGLLYSAIAVAGLSVLYMFYRTQIASIVLALGVTLIIYSLTNDISVSLISGALAGLITTHYSRSKEGFVDVNDEEEDTKSEEKPKKKTKKAVAPDNGDRAEFFELGKKYKGPKEEDDNEFHLDAGTTFMNAYKSLKPDQVAAMTKDTQELMETQKQLMSTLQTLKPLIQDGKEMMNMFQGYFGSGQMSAN
jgi:hypothetical protein